MPEENEIKVRFTIADFDCNPQELTTTLGIEPTRTWRDGDRIPGTKRAYQGNGWRLESHLPKTADIEEHIERLLDQLEDRSSRFAQLAGAYLEFGCIVFAHEYVPAIHFSRQLIKRVASLGAAIDVDLYCLLED